MQTGERRGFTTRPIAQTKPFVKGAKGEDTLTPVLEDIERRVPDLVARIEAGEAKAEPLTCRWCSCDIVCRIPPWDKAELSAAPEEETTEASGATD